MQAGGWLPPQRLSRAAGAASPSGDGDANLNQAAENCDWDGYGYCRFTEWRRQVEPGRDEYSATRTVTAAGPGRETAVASGQRTDLVCLYFNSATVHHRHWDSSCQDMCGGLAFSPLTLSRKEVGLESNT